AAKLIEGFTAFTAKVAVVIRFLLLMTG
ncbi:hypothetical protein M2129_002198, partial [Polynucleobacter sphagniphilus]|nr:hypothetical protein [Polynucleobacter sphagniphilus]